MALKTQIKCEYAENKIKKKSQGIIPVISNL